MRALLGGFAVVLGACSHFAEVGDLRTVDAAVADSAVGSDAGDSALEANETSSILVEDAPPMACDDVDEDGDGVPIKYGEKLCGTDCNDNNKDVFPGQTKFFTFADDTAEFDYDCNRIQEKHFTVRARCENSGDSCAFTEGWIDDVPGCGVTARWLKACTKLATGGCGAAAANIEMRVQECR
jgi:hypothetical protein